MDREEDEEDEEYEDDLMKWLTMAALMREQTLFGKGKKRKRSRSRERDRRRAEQSVNGWTDETLRRQLRMTRSSFMKLREMIEQKFPPGELSEEMARRSSGSTISVAIKLYVTLRVLAGA